MVIPTACPDLIAQFRSLTRRGERLGVAKGFPREFRDSRDSLLYTVSERGESRVRGVRRYGDYLLVTGTFPLSRSPADLLILHLGSRSAGRGPWGSNLSLQSVPAETDRLRRAVELDGNGGRAGSLSLLDTLAAIPLEQPTGASKIVFANLADPEAPRLLPAVIERPTWGASACALTRLEDERLLLAVWSHGDAPSLTGAAAPYHLDLYCSTGSTCTTGFHLVARIWPAPCPDRGDAHCHCLHHRWRSMDFVWERAAHGGRLFLVAFEHTDGALPRVRRGSRACLFTVNLDALFRLAPASAPVTLPSAALSWVDEVLFDTGDSWCQMNGGASIYLDDDHRLLVYGVPHRLLPFDDPAFRHVPALRCLEFQATDFHPASRAEEIWMGWRQGAGLRKRHLTLLSPGGAALRGHPRERRAVYRELRRARRENDAAS